VLSREDRRPAPKGFETLVFRLLPLDETNV